jgi:uncharacterized protein YggE
VLNARAKAGLIATTLVETHGYVENVNEQMFDYPRPMFRAEMMEAAASKDMAANPDAFAAGELEIRVNVHAVFRLQQ